MFEIATHELPTQLNKGEGLGTPIQRRSEGLGETAIEVDAVGEGGVDELGDEADELGDEESAELEGVIDGG